MLLMQSMQPQHLQKNLRIAGRKDASFYFQACFKTNAGLHFLNDLEKSSNFKEEHTSCCHVQSLVVTHYVSASVSSCNSKEEGAFYTQVTVANNAIYISLTNSHIGYLNPGGDLMK